MYVRMYTVTKSRHSCCTSAAKFAVKIDTVTKTKSAQSSAYPCTRVVLKLRA